VTYRYCRIPDMEDWLRLGWLPTSALDGTHHGDWSVLCVWICGCAPPSLRVKLAGRT
jgi:hypothetical protein